MFPHYWSHYYPNSKKFKKPFKYGINTPLLISETRSNKPKTNLIKLRDSKPLPPISMRPSARLTYCSQFKNNISAHNLGQIGYSGVVSTQVISTSMLPKQRKGIP